MLKKINFWTWVLIVICTAFSITNYFLNSKFTTPLVILYVLFIVFIIYRDITEKEGDGLNFEPIYTEKELEDYMKYHNRQYLLYKSIKDIRRTCKHLDKRPIGNGKFHCPTCCQLVKEDSNEILHPGRDN